MENFYNTYKCLYVCNVKEHLWKKNICFILASSTKQNIRRLSKLSVKWTIQISGGVSECLGVQRRETLSKVLTPHIYVSEWRSG